ncbi:hypothetical protein BpHYR1_016449 [Brachionus plicatilis]|uniref:Uncharacterized protein n=1 Tax=Brachionus plicatilis TaxID=10195 RepID=A0A3M7PN64_BRAPC|nr:hypothetical protein BpHYR1_016449 [Brachionus plicatilis]
MAQHYVMISGITNEPRADEFLRKLIESHLDEAVEIVWLNNMTRSQQEIADLVEVSRKLQQSAIMRRHPCKDTIRKSYTVIEKLLLTVLNRPNGAKNDKDKLSRTGQNITPSFVYQSYKIVEIRLVLDAAPYIQAELINFSYGHSIK